MAKGAVTVTVLLNAIGIILVLILSFSAGRFIFSFIVPSDSQASANNFQALSSAIKQLSEDSYVFSTQRVPFYIDDYSVVVGFDNNSRYSYHDCYSNTASQVGNAILTFGTSLLSAKEDDVFTKDASCGDDACLCLYTMKDKFRFAKSSAKSSNFNLVSCSKLPDVDKIITPSYKQLCTVMNNKPDFCVKQSSVKVGLSEEDKVANFVANFRGKERSQAIAEYPLFEVGDIKTKFYADAVIFGHCDSGFLNSITSSFQSKSLYVEKVRAEGETGIMIAGDFSMMDDRKLSLLGKLASPDDVKLYLDSLDIVDAVETATAILSNSYRTQEDQFKTLVYLGMAFEKASQSSQEMMKKVFAAANIPEVLDMEGALKKMADARYQWAKDLSLKCCQNSPLLSELPQSL